MLFWRNGLSGDESCHYFQPIILHGVTIPKKLSYFPPSCMYGFSDASGRAYSGVVYLRMEDSNGMIYTSLVASKTRVAPIKRVTIPRLELNGALILSQILSHCKELLDLPLSSVFAWTDSTIVSLDPRKPSPFQRVRRESSLPDN